LARRMMPSPNDVQTDLGAPGQLENGFLYP
jgi:hypothetical protein